MKNIFLVFRLVIKRGITNWKLELNLFLSLLLGVAIISSIPIFTDGALHFGFQKALEEYKEYNKTSPNVIDFFYPVNTDLFTFKKYDRLSRLLENEANGLPLSHVRFQRYGSVERFFKRDTTAGTLFSQLIFLTDFEDMIHILDGRLPQTIDPVTGGIEVMVEESCFHEFELIVGKKYPYEYKLEADPEKGRTREEKKIIDITIVGLFRLKPEYAGTQEMFITYPQDKFFITEETHRALVAEGLDPGGYYWHWFIDKEDLVFSKYSDSYPKLTSLEKKASQVLPGVIWSTGPKDVILEYRHQAFIISTLLYAISLPLIGIILYYIILTVQLLINVRRTEIALLQSRGGGKFQVCMSYILEWGILGFIALLTGPFIGLFIAQVLGASRGFLDFVNREPIPVRLTLFPYFVSGALVLFTIIITLVPVFIASKKSIVHYKQETSRTKGIPLWQKIPIDLLLIGFSIYGFYSLKVQAESGELIASDVLDPTLYLFPVLFIIGCVLLVIRLLPFITRFIDFITSRWSNVPLDLTLKCFARSPNHYNPLIFLIITTLSLGIYSSSTARTMDRTFIDAQYYETGADVVLHEKWEALSFEKSQFEDDTLPEIYEPPFYFHEQCPGVASAARVMKLDKVRVQNATYENRKYTLSLMALDPYEFYKTGWFRKNLLSYPLQDYLNLLIQYPQGIFIDKEQAEKSGLKPGDLLMLSFGKANVGFTVLGVVECWPTCYPEDGPFGIVDLTSLQNFIPLTPYSVWLRLEPGAKLAEIVNELNEKDIVIRRIEDTRRQVIEGIRKPERSGLYGMLSTGFLMAAFITVAGFLFYMFLSLRKRTLQFGILRAIGLKISHVMMMLVFEVLFTVGLSTFIGTILGEQTSKLFLPLLRMSSRIKGDIPPFIVVIEWADKAGIYFVLGFSLLISLLGLAFFVSRLKIHQAVKLGEDL